MHNLNLKFTKIFIVILAMAVVVIMTSGIKMLKNSYYFNFKYLGLHKDYIITDAAWYRYEGNFPIWPFKKKSVSADESNQKQARLIPVLVYHGVISDSDWKPDGVNVGKRDFRDQMFALKKDGWETIRAQDYVSFIKGKKKLPEKSFLLTFDDGRKDSFYESDAALRAVGYSAVMFVITGRSLGPDNDKSPFHLSELELKKMVESGRWEMDSHTRNSHGSDLINAEGNEGHLLSNLIWRKEDNRLETQEEYKKRVESDLKAAKADIEKKLGVTSSVFAYPYGDLGQNASNFAGGKEILKGIANSIYDISFIQAGNNDFVSNPADGNFLSKRIGSDSSISGEGLVHMLNNSREKPLPFADDFKIDRGWLRGWGDLNVGKGQLLIGTNKEDDSASTFLSGSTLWKDYDVFAKAKIVKGNSFSIAVRYRDGGNYVTCDFSPGEISLSQKTQKTGNEPKTLMAFEQEGLMERGVLIEVGAKVKGNSVSCYAGGKLIISGKIDDSLNYGGIGFKTWDSDGQGSVFSLNNLKVDGN